MKHNNKAILSVAPAEAGAQKTFVKTTVLLSFPAQLWVPAFAGTTEEGAGTTEEGAGTTRGEMLCLFPYAWVASLRPQRRGGI